jgi:hypothetical protein
MVRLRCSSPASARPRIRPGAKAAIALGAFAVFALASCTATVANSDAPETDFSTITDDSSTTLAPTTSAPAPPASILPTVQAGKCPALAAVANPGVVDDEQADVDGDGAADSLTSYLGANNQWHLRAQLAAGGGVDVTVPAAAPGVVTVVGGADIDGQPGAEILVSVGVAQQGNLVAFYKLENCQLVRLEAPDGSPSAFAVGATDTTAQGLKCQPPELLVLQAVTEDGQHFSTQDIALQLHGNRFVERDHQHS